MKIIDIILLLLILLGGYFGYKKGFLVEVLSFFAFVIAIITAFKLMHTGISYFTKDPESDDSTIPYLSFLLIFLGVFISILLLGKFLKKILHYTPLGVFDSWAGALTGALKTAFAISLLLWLTHYAKIDLPESIISESLIYPELISFAPKVVQYISLVIPFQDVFPLIEKTLQEQ